MESPAYLRRADGINPYKPCITNSLDLFSLPLLDMSTQNNYIAPYSPSQPIVSTTTEIRFNLGTSTDFTNLGASNIYVELHLVDENGGALPAFTATESVGLGKKNPTRS